MIANQSIQYFDDCNMIGADLPEFYRHRREIIMYLNLFKLLLHLYFDSSAQIFADLRLETISSVISISS